MTFPPPFVVFALPRSRSFWVSRFLNYGGWTCGHDEVRHARSLDDIRSWLSLPATGTVETAAAPFWRLLLRYRPDVRIAVVRRPVAEVHASLMRFGCFDAERLHTTLRLLDHKLDQIAHRVPGALSLSYADLATEATCARLFEHCLPWRHDPAWWAATAALNLQTDLLADLRYCRAYAPQLAKLAKVAKHRCISFMRPVEHEFDGVSFQAEPFRVVCRDAEALVREHCAITGRMPGYDFNVPLFERLDDAGALQTMSARSNGRCFGYLVSIVGPSLDAANIIHGTHTAFYASPAIRGLGLRLLRAANDALRDPNGPWGVHAIIMRAGVLGSGPRLGSLYRRIGAEPFGELYRLEAV